MFRSQPFKKKEVAQELNPEDLEKEELDAFLSRQE